MSKTVIAIRHVHFEDLGTLDLVFETLGYSVRYVEAPSEDLLAPNLLDADILVILGGPIGAFDDDKYPFIKDEVHLVRQRLASDRPILGICLGAQLIARALGAKVAPMGRNEIGYSSMVLTTAGEESPLRELHNVSVLHWHGDQFDIPEGAARLAGSEVCSNQAFSVGRNVLGLQFHLEADAERIESWLVGHASELAHSKVDPRTIRSDAQAFKAQLASAAQRVIGRWVRAIDSVREEP